MVSTRINTEKFETNPALFLEETIKEYVATSPGNRLKAFNDDPIWEEPLIGFADGDDPIFRHYKKVIGDFHLTPREALAKHLQGKGLDGENPPEKVSVISWVLPIPLEARLSLRRETLVPSLRWNHTRWPGQDFLNELARYVVSLLGELGHQAVAPDLASFRETRELANGPASNWSHKHIAYAAGLGTFGIHCTLITAKGSAMRTGSVVTDLALPPTPRTYTNYLGNCLFARDGSCGRCIERCPVNALSPLGFDKKRCREYNYHIQGKILKEAGREEGYLGHFPVCGLCQTKVPCEDRIPPGIPLKD